MDRVKVLRVGENQPKIAINSSNSLHKWGKKGDNLKEDLVEQFSLIKSNH